MTSSRSPRKKGGHRTHLHQRGRLENASSVSPMKRPGHSNTCITSLIPITRLDRLRNKTAGTRVVVQSRREVDRMIGATSVTSLSSQTQTGDSSGSHMSQPVFGKMATLPAATSKIRFMEQARISSAHSHSLPRWSERWHICAYEGVKKL